LDSSRKPYGKRYELRDLTDLRERDAALLLWVHFSLQTDEQIYELTRRARAGEKHAGDTLIADVQHYLEMWAWRYSSAFGWASRRIEYTELIGIGNLTLVEKLPAALAKTNPARIACWARYTKFRY
jgi:hypothetical protein